MVRTCTYRMVKVFKKKLYVSDELKNSNVSINLSIITKIKKYPILLIYKI